MKHAIFVLFMVFAGAVQADPLITSWVTSISSKYGRIYANTTNRSAGAASITWTNGTYTQSSPTYAGVNEINSSTSYVYIRTTGFGGHVMGPWNNPSLPLNQKALWRFPRMAAVPTTNRVSTALTPMGSMGYYVDGVAAYNTSDGFSYSYSHSSDAAPNTNFGQGDGIWNRDAYPNEAVSFDYALAHNQQGGEYHYHVDAVATRYLLGDNIIYNSSTKNYSENTATVNFNHSPILGWMKDGLPIYGPYGYDGGGTGATATASRTANSISSVTVNTRGSYFATPAVTFTGGGGSGAAAAANLRAVTAVIASSSNSSAGGTGYKVGDTLTVVGGTSTVTATLTVASITGAGSSGPIATLNVTQAGSYSVVPPNYTSVTGGSGTGAVPTVTWEVDTITMTNAGSGYTSDPTVKIGGVRRMISGYQLRDGTNNTTNLNSTGRHSLPAWALTAENRGQLTSATQFGPNVSASYALGHYAEDYDYLGDLGHTQSSRANSGGAFFDLDAHNTRFCVTPEYPNGTWAYFTTINSSGTPVYPYFAGRWFRGNPATGGGKTTDAVLNSDTHTQNFLGGANTPVTIGTPGGSGNTVTLTWNAAEGSTYSVSASTDNAAYTTEKTGVIPNNVPGAPTTGNTSVTATTSYTKLTVAGNEYAKVTRTALAAYDSAGQTAATVAQNAVITLSGSSFASIVVQLNGSNLVNNNTVADFGSVYPGNNGSLSFTIKNTGGADLTLGSLSITGADNTEFTLGTSPTSPVTPSGSTTFSLTFTPAVLGIRSATLHIPTNDPNTSEFLVPLQGTGSLASTSAATTVLAGYATLNGSGNPNGVSSTAYFVYGTTTGYGSNTAAVNLGSGSTPVTANFNLAGLAAGTTYHYQMVVNSNGTLYYGGDKTFTTPASSPAAWHSAQITGLSNPNTANMADGSRTGVAHASSYLYYYKGTDSNIWCVVLSGGQWVQQQLSSDSNVDDWLAYGTQYNLLCYRGKDNNLWALYFNGSQWVTVALGSNANVAGDVVIDTAWNIIYYRGSDSHVWAAQWNGSQWTRTSLGGTASVKDNLAVDPKYHLVYYRGTDNQLWCYSWTGTAWSQVQLTTVANVGGSIASDSGGGLAYYKSETGNAAWCTYWTGSAWSQQQLDAAASIGSGGGNTTPYPKQYDLLYVDNSGQCRAEYWTGSQWIDLVLGDGGTSLTGALSVQPTTNWFFCRRGDGNVVVFYYR
jgi:hypothetical protein